MRTKENEKQQERINAYAQKLGFRLKQLRSEKNVDLQKMAKDLGLSYSALIQYERGTRNPGTKTQVLLAEYFDVDVDYLMGRSDYSKRTEDETISIEEMNLIRHYREADEKSKLIARIALNVQNKY